VSLVNVPGLLFGTNSHVDFAGSRRCVPNINRVLHSDGAVGYHLVQIPTFEQQ